MVEECIRNNDVVLAAMKEYTEIAWKNSHEKIFNIEFVFDRKREVIKDIAKGKT